MLGNLNCHISTVAANKTEVCIAPKDTVLLSKTPRCVALLKIGLCMSLFQQAKLKKKTACATNVLCGNCEKKLA